MALFDDVKDVVVEQLDCNPDEVKEGSKFIE
ncbi:MAG: acyl carrier protein, partial [Arcobacteraceae bacterium]|nr:acyl carrier protein [Arcobacteraceae bacterium]